MGDGGNSRSSKNAALFVPVWDHAGLSRDVADDLTAVFGSGPRPALRNETVLYSHPKTQRADSRGREGSRSNLGLAVRIGLILAAGVVGLTAGWLLTHPPGRMAASTQDIEAPANGLVVQVEGAPSR